MTLLFGKFQHRPKLPIILTKPLPPPLGCFPGKPNVRIKTLYNKELKN